MRVDDSVLGVVENLPTNNPGPAEDDEIELHAIEVRHHLGRPVDWDGDEQDAVFGGLFSDRGRDRVALDALEELLTFLVADRRVLLDYDLRDIAS